MKQTIALPVVDRTAVVVIAVDVLHVEPRAAAAAERFHHLARVAVDFDCRKGAAFVLEMFQLGLPLHVPLDGTANPLVKLQTLLSVIDAKAVGINPESKKKRYLVAAAFVVALQQTLVVDLHDDATSVVTYIAAVLAKAYVAVIE